MDKEEAAQRAQTGEKPNGGYYNNQERITLQKFSLGRIRTLPSSIFGSGRSGGRGGRGGVIVPMTRAIDPGALVAPPAPPSIDDQKVNFLQKQINDLVKRDQEQIDANNNLINSLQKQFNVIGVSVTDLGKNLNAVGKLLQSDSLLEQNKNNQEISEQKQAAEANYRKGSENELEKKIIGALMAPVKAIGEKMQFTLANLMRFFGILFTGWLVDKVIDSFKADSEGNKKKFEDIKNLIIKNLLIVGGILTVLNLGFFRIAGSIGSLAFKIGRFVIGNTLGRLFSGIASLATKLGQATSSFFGIGTKAAPAASAGSAAARAGASAAGSADDIARGTAGSADDIARSSARAAAGSADDVAKGASKTLGKFVPGLGTVLSGAAATYDFSQGDILGGSLNTVGMIPGPIGWVGTLGRLGLEGTRMLGGNNQQTTTNPATNPATTSQSKPATKPTSSTVQPQAQVLSGALEPTLTSSSAFSEVSQPQSKILPSSTSTSPSNTSTIGSSSNSQGVMNRTENTNISSTLNVSQPQTPALPPPSPEMTKNFQMAWDNRNNGFARGRIEFAWNNMTPEQQQQAKIWAQSKGYNWNEMKLVEKSPPPQIIEFKPTQSQSSGNAQIESPQPQLAQVQSPISSIVGPAPEPKPNIIYSSSKSQQNSQPRTPLKTGAASDVPFIPSSNPDNFYLLYSQIQYNVVI